MKRFVPAAVAVLLAASGGVASAQHRHYHLHRHATPWNQNQQVLVDPHGHAVVAHHDHYHHVLSPQARFRGTYYTYNDVHYFYPTQPVVTAQNVGVAPQPVSVEFGSFSHVDDLAGRLEDMANQFCLDLHYNYQHNPGFGETYAEAFQILQAAQWAHAAEHQQDREGLARTLGPMDDLFHHVQEDVQGWQRIHRRQIGQLGIVDKMVQMEALIHHLCHDVGVRPAHDEAHEQAPPPGGRLEQAPPPGTPLGTPFRGAPPANVPFTPIPSPRPL